MINMRIRMLAMALWIALQYRRTPEAWGSSGRAAPDHESPCAIACASKVEGFHAFCNTCCGDLRQRYINVFRRTAMGRPFLRIRRSHFEVSYHSHTAPCAPWCRGWGGGPPPTTVMLRLSCARLCRGAALRWSTVTANMAYHSGLS
jgi:hypothetical protein